MKKSWTKIVLAGVMALVLVIPLIADALGRGDDGVGNSSGITQGGGSMGVPVINSRQGIQGGSVGIPDQNSVMVPNFSGSSSGPGLDNGKRRSRSRDGTDTK